MIGIFNPVKKVDLNIISNKNENIKYYQSIRLLFLF